MDRNANDMMNETAGGELRNIIVNAVRANAVFTDLHIEEDEVIKWKLPLGWENLPGNPFATRDMIEGLCQNLREDWKDVLEKEGSFDKAIPMSDCRLRMNVFFTREKSRIAFSIRRHPLVPMDIDKTCLPDEAKKLLSWSTKGLIVISGATGSGKTTTLSAIVDYFNRHAQANKRDRQLHIVTIEQPIEFHHERKNAIISSKSVPQDTPSFAAGLRDALRQKPDVILIGEVRDADTAETMMAAAESGHLVLATLHTNSAVSTINKILSFFPESEQAMRRQMLSQMLLGVSSQVMIPSTKGDQFVVVAETLLCNTRRVSESIAKGDFNAIQEMIERDEDNLKSLNTTLLEYVKANKITGEAAVRGSYRPIAMMEAVRKLITQSR